MLRRGKPDAKKWRGIVESCSHYSYHYELHIRVKHKFVYIFQAYCRLYLLRRPLIIMGDRIICVGKSTNIKGRNAECGHEK